MTREAEGALDLDLESRGALELDAVLGEVASFAGLEPAAEAIRSLEPLCDPGAIAEELSLVEEAREALRSGGRIVGAGLPDPRPALRATAVEGLAAEASALRDLAAVLLAASDARRALLDSECVLGERLRLLGGAIPDLTAIARPIAMHVGPDGKLLDGASAELDRVRRTLAKTGERLRRQLKAFIHDPSAAAAVRDDFVTQRNGRFVIPIRTDAPKPVAGIVHAASSSGLTLFVEPLESVELNNELVRLAEQERVEEDRVLIRWTHGLRSRLPEVDAAVAGLVRIDAIQARALHASSIDAVRPEVGAGFGLVLRQARHPLLDRRLREQGSRCVPLSMDLAADERALVLSGPNTGGKTVALKTVGLLVVMAHAGLHVPAAEARFPVFRRVRADIGDRQSIEADLSTFSAHVRAVATWLQDAEPPALFLFDEIGTGTEPTEGAALAQALLERLMRLGVHAVVTTHQGALKAWAFTSPGAASAALEFDERSLRPTYRILMGAAGTSAGLAVASRLGLDGDLMGRAREILGEGGRQVEAAMARLRDLTSEAEERRLALDRREREVEERETEAGERASRERERERRETAEALDALLGEFRETVRRELAGIADRKERARVEREAAKASLRVGAARREKERRLRPAVRPPAASVPFEPRPGVAVRIVSLEREGVVESVRGDRVAVRMGTATFTVGRGDLAPATSEPEPRPTAGAGGRFERVRDDVEVPLEIHLLGKTVDEALPELDRFLDAAALSGRPEVRVIHGHGTGRLRAAVRRFLDGHAHVERIRPGGPGEGGDGATVVTLR